MTLDTAMPRYSAADLTISRAIPSPSCAAWQMTSGVTRSARPSARSSAFDRRPPASAARASRTIAVPDERASKHPFWPQPHSGPSGRMQTCPISPGSNEAPW